MEEQNQESHNEKQRQSWRPIVGVVLAIAAVVLITVAIANIRLSKGEASVPLNAAPVPSNPTSTASSPDQKSLSATSASPSPASVCDDLLARQDQIDNGSKRGLPGKINTVDMSHSIQDYKQLKDCWRKRMSPSKPDVSYNGPFRHGLQLGMSTKEVVNALPKMPAEIVGTIENDPGNVHNFDWVYIDCRNISNSHDNITAACNFIQPITTEYRASFNMPFPPSVMLYFDKDAADGKLLGWDLQSSFSTKFFKSSDEVIRFQRETELAMLGPPDLANSHSAKWFFNDDQGKELVSVMLDVHPVGRALVISLTIADDENENKRPVFRK